MPVEAGRENSAPDSRLAAHGTVKTTRVRANRQRRPRPSAQEPTMPAVSACPDRQVFLHFLQGKLSVAEVLRLEEHLGQCEPCRGVLQAAAAEQPPAPPSLSEASSAIERVL